MAFENTVAVKGLICQGRQVVRIKLYEQKTDLNFKPPSDMTVTESSAT